MGTARPTREGSGTTNTNAENTDGRQSRQRREGEFSLLNTSTINLFAGPSRAVVVGHPERSADEVCGHPFFVRMLT